MLRTLRKLNMVLGGGGVKGIAYIGTFSAMERRGYISGNIAGVSAGALAGSLAAAGYGTAGMWDAMNKFDFDRIQMEKVSRKLPVIKRYMEFAGACREWDNTSIEKFFSPKKYYGMPDRGDLRRGWLMNAILTYSKEGCLFDGDLLEEWIAKTLLKRGVRTFADLRGGTEDDRNPRGYKIRMTGVDTTRVKVVTLPDDMEFYGMDPDKFEVARAVRISTSVPFAFKPVEIAFSENGTERTNRFVDGGVLDSFPSWLISGANTPTAGFRLNAGESKIFSIDTPLAILKGLVAAVHDIGTPADGAEVPVHVCEINTAKVDFLDFGLNDSEKRYLLSAGRKSTMNLFDQATFRSQYTRRI